MRDEAITKFESSEPNDDATRREAFYEAAAFKRIRRKLENRIAKFDHEPTTPRNP
jgi:exosome complex RNA-binding protein Csl4